MRVANPIKKINRTRSHGIWAQMIDTWRHYVSIIFQKEYEIVAEFLVLEIHDIPHAISSCHLNEYSCLAESSIFESKIYLMGLADIRAPPGINSIKYK